MAVTIGESTDLCDADVLDFGLGQEPSCRREQEKVRGEKDCGSTGFSIHDGPVGRSFRTEGQATVSDVEDVSIVS